MPCFKQEKSRSRRDTTNDTDPIAPKPVRPRALKYHGLFGMSIAAQHLIVDDNWSPSSINEQFTNMTELLSRFLIYKRHETKTNHSRLLVESKRLKTQCADGRIKLKNISSGNNAHKIRNFLIKHKEMQRLYQKMPIHLIADNINQRTFVLRKERDRLEDRLTGLKMKFKNLLLSRSKVENLIKYENEFVLEEERLSRVFQKKIENSNMRLKAIRTINITYKKMVQVLLQDEIFYEPILRSLDDDMEDQVNFIKHILYLGMPAIAKFRELNHKFFQLESKSRKNLQAKIKILNSMKNPVVTDPAAVKVNEISADPKRYLRETESMQTLKMQLLSIEKTIKNLKLTTLCSQAKEIYPRIKGKFKENVELRRKIEHDWQCKRMLRAKRQCASMLSNLLINNLSEEEINRLERIKELKKILIVENEFEEENVLYIRNRADLYVMLRLFLWNLMEVLRHVDRSPNQVNRDYPNSYLRLPLLKFELYHMYAVPPELYPTNIDVIMQLLKRTVYKLMKGYRPKMSERLEESKNSYHLALLATFEPIGTTQDKEQDIAAMEDDLITDRAMANIPNSKKIKAQSAKFVEEACKRDEQ
ncbi:uncharacterized protein LOC115761703 [Drosophila novamexicana]|uniref:uncharacterized protein LOC115761703 n=1 Tax=Drosophila novamexicana TaxID=47314 RepID=UPI0011E5B5BD|nr:uncharacterized protein LOC115761703 [Drosophila novamexicana]